MHLVHTVVLNFKHPFILDTPAIGGHKTFMHFLPYLLLVYLGELFANSFLPFSSIFFNGIIPDFIECMGASRLGLVIKNFNF